MRVIFHDSTDPYFNLAAEQFLIDNTKDDIFMVWRNDRSVIIGRNQNAWTELDTDYARREQIAVVRRLTGGGAVFHDIGNVNFTFITSGDTIDFAAFAAPILDLLRECGVQASLGGRNDLVTSDGAKISGCAACVRRAPDNSSRRLHHGTLLYDADLSALARVLVPDTEKLMSKGINSVRSRVANIRSLSPHFADTDASRFASLVANYGARSFDSTIEDLRDDEKSKIEELAKSKYRTWEWNFGTSPECTVRRSRRFAFGRVTAELTLSRGAIDAIRLTGDFFSSADVDELEARLGGVRLDHDSVAEMLSDVDRFIAGASCDEITALICG